MHIHGEWNAYMGYFNCNVCNSFCNSMLMHACNSILFMVTSKSVCEMIITICVCLIMNHRSIVQQNSRGSACDEFHFFCSHLFDYESLQ